MGTIQIRTEMPGPRSRELMAAAGGGGAARAVSFDADFCGEGGRRGDRGCGWEPLYRFCGGIGCANMGHRNAAVTQRGG